MAIKSRKMELEGHATPMGQIGSIYRIVVRKPEGKKRLWET
jgi:hypothetical protein